MEKSSNIKCKLNLPSYDFKYEVNELGKELIYDEFRQKWLVLTPEEWVRQNFAKYLNQQLNYPKSRLKFEKHFKVDKLSKKADIVFYDRKLNAQMIVECKAPNIPISQAVAKQAAIYNSKLRVELIILTNGLNHLCIKLDYEKNSFEYLSKIPAYSL